ncbi:hypothetical protein [Nonomuraea dietziae]|uniref:hypothetical protein n=1 Tax=Nonomuraea dietziae TaxID=65515 RepID=UPI0031D3D291
MLRRGSPTTRADALWGPAVAEVDLNSWQAEDRIELPDTARPGQRLVVHFDAGGRLDALVTRRPDDDLGSNLDFSSLRYSKPAEAQWSWGVAAVSAPTAAGRGPRPLCQAGAWRRGAHPEGVGAATRRDAGTAGRVVVGCRRRGGRDRTGRLDVAQRGVVRLVAGRLGAR